MTGHHHHHDSAATGRDPSKRVAITLALVVVYMIAEVVGGLLSGSLALLADAGHMLSDAGALVVSLYAIRIARRPASKTHTFGYQRAEILAALANGAALLAISGYIFFEAAQRIRTPYAVEGELMLAIAGGGLVVNLVGLWLLHHDKQHSLNVRGAWLHVLADTMGSVGAIAAGSLVVLFGWYWADAVASIVIGALVLWSAWSLIKQTVGVLMQAVPERVDLANLERVMLAVDGVRDVHDLHVWSVTSGRNVMSAHVTVDASADRDDVVHQLQDCARELDVHHTTFQLDCPEDCASCT